MHDIDQEALLDSAYSGVILLVESRGAPYREGPEGYNLYLC